MNTRASLPPETPAAASEPHSTPARVPISKLALYFLRLGTLGFGGPVALCGLMEKELVTEKGWLTKDEMRDAIAISHPLPTLNGGGSFTPIHPQDQKHDYRGNWQCPVLRD